METVREFGTFDVGLAPGPNVFMYADDAFLGILTGTARTSALLRRQTPEALAQIRESVRAAMAAHAAEGEFHVPMPAVLAVGTKT